MLPASHSRSPLLAFAAALALAGLAGAQVSTGYNFTQNVGTYNPITGGTVLGAGTGVSGASSLDDVYYPVTLPFAFNFDGSAQTSIYVSTNGYLTFGTTAPSTYTPLSATTTYRGAVSAFGCDLQGGWVFSCDRVLGSNLLTNVSSNGPMQVGDFLTGTGIPSGATIAAIGGSTITMSVNATTTGTAGYAGANGPWSEVRYETLGTAPNRVFVVQWQNFKRYGYTTLTSNQHMTLNFQILLHETSEIEVAYGMCSPGLATTTTSPCQTGLRGPNATFPANINNRMVTKGVNDDWSLSVAGTSNTATMTYNIVAPANVIANGLTYLWTPAGIRAVNETYGTGCYDVSATAYETFAAGTIDLSNTAIHMTPNGSGGYVFTPGYATSFVHTGPSLLLGDDAVGTLALPSAFAYSGGSTTSLTVCSNGYIWMQPSTLADYSPTSAELFGNGARLCPMWCDGVPDGTTGVDNVWAEVDTANNKAYVTYVNVPIYGGVGGTINLQTEFNLTTGEINVAYGAISCGNTSLVGWTPGTGFSTLDSGNHDITAVLPSGFSTLLPEVPALALAAAPAPVIGTTMVYTTSNIPASALVTYQLISLFAVNPGIDLGGIGAPGCLQFVDLATAAATVLAGSPTATLSFVVPNDLGLVGLPLNAQSASIVLSANPLGVITSNAVHGAVGTF